MPTRIYIEKYANFSSTLQLTDWHISVFTLQVARCKTAGPLSVLSDDVAAVPNLQGADGASGLDAAESSPMTRYEFPYRFWHQWSGNSFFLNFFCFKIWVQFVYIQEVFHQFPDLGWVDFDLGSSPICLFWLRQMGFRQKWLSSLARWWNIANHVKQTHELMRHLVVPKTNMLDFL